jgi:hypothetical protein
MTLVIVLTGAQMSLIIMLFGIFTDMKDRQKLKGNNPSWVIWPIYLLRR